MSPDAKRHEDSEYGAGPSIAPAEGEMTAAERHSLLMRHGTDSPEARRGGIDRRHRQGLLPKEDER